MTALQLTIDQIKVTVRRSDRTRRLMLKLDPLLGPILVLPTKASLRDAETFLYRNKLWLENRLAQTPAHLPFVAGGTFPLRGTSHTICHSPEARRGVWVEQGILYVSGQAEHLPRRIRDYLKAETLRIVRPLAFDLSAKIQTTPSRITIRTLKTRWGSCSSARDLSFSWRLIMAPDEILTYVVAHEVAHLAQMNHSPAFWALVEQLHPNHQKPKHWLKAHGASLFRYGN